MVFIAKGNCTLGSWKKDKDGNIVEKNPAMFEETENGGCVLVGIMDVNTMKQVGDGKIFGDYDSYGFLMQALEFLGSTRESNTPDFKEVLKRMYRRDSKMGCPFEPYCTRSGCGNCVCVDWMLEVQDEEKK